MNAKDKIRQKAAEILASRGGIDKSLYEKNLESLVEELSIYQIELENQNHELIESQQKEFLSNNRYIELFNNAPIGYFIIDRNYKIKEVNQTACSLLNNQRELIAGTSFTKWIHPDYQNQFYFFFKEIFKEPGFNSCEVKMKNSQEHYFYANLAAVPNNYFMHSQVAELRIAVSDISVQKELEARIIDESEKARESERLKSAFLANMSHEIRTPLNGILGFSSLIAEDVPDQIVTKKYAEIIVKNGERLLSLLNNILDISKVESGTMRLNKSVFAVSDLINDVFELYEVTASSKNIEISKTIPPQFENLKIYADRGKLTQICNNLLSNAIKFTRKGTVEIGFQLQNNQILFSVTDSGIGISNEGLLHLFERFYQVNTKDAYNTEGTGLGLSLCKSLVEFMNGKIWVVSNPGLGSTFSFAIPHEDFDNAAQEDDQNIRKVLLVEDDIKQAQLIRLLLEKNDLKVIVASNGYEALKLIENSPAFGMIIMDINMPKINGFEVSKEIRKFNNRIPMVAITGFSSQYSQQQAIQVGFNDYIIKPLTKDRVTKIIKRFFAA